jgi:hypothetical protein
MHGASGSGFGRPGLKSAIFDANPTSVAIPAKKITHSDAMSITLGAKRRWRRLCWPD